MSSPRQKMVFVVPNELEQKKKKQPLERAKATHLSKQLQMRLQYAKLKVEHGWQRQNLNEVENLYFHHSHQRSMRQGARQRPHYATVTCPPGGASMSTETSVHSSGVLERTVESTSLANDASLSGSVSPPSQSSPENPSNADGRPSTHLQPHLPVQTSLQVAPPTMTNRPPSVLDLTDPNVLARLAQIQTQVQLPSQSQALAQTQVQDLSRTIPPHSTPSVYVSDSQPFPLTIPISVPGAFSPHVPSSQPPTNIPQASFTLSSFTSQPLGAPTPSLAPVYPISASTINNSNSATTSQPPAPTSISTTVSIPTSAPIPHAALTYDSFWSTHASSAGTTRALYRTHTGFTTSATPGGNVAMLTPGGNAAVMTSEGVYVGGSGK